MNALPQLIEREFYLGRHGETDDNARDRLSTPLSALTQKGKDQALEMRQAFRLLFPKGSPCYLVSSALKRAVDTAEIMCEGECVHPDERLNEHSNGKMEGILAITQYHRMKEYFARRSNPDDRFAEVKGYQKRVDHTAQVIPAINEHLQKCPEGIVPVFVSHIGTSQRIAAAMGFPDVHFKNATLYHCVPDRITHQWHISEVGIERDEIVRRPTEVSPFALKVQSSSSGVGARA